VATLVEVVTLNALLVSRWVRGVDWVDPGSCKSENFWSQGFLSIEPRTSRSVVEGTPSVYMCGLDRCIHVDGALTRYLLGGFQGADSMGVYSFQLLVLGTPNLGT
jgi:hypothetical protein